LSTRHKPRAVFACRAVLRAILVAAALLFLAGIRVMAQPATSPSAPPTIPAWQTAAGGHMEFEVASIHLGEPGTFMHPNIVLNNEDTPVPPGGQFAADFPLQIFIEFAYKIMPTHEQEEAMLAHLPKWVATDHFVIQARFAGSPTKDQIRLMVQSLLAERFKLAVHIEAREVPVLGVVLDKPGRIGPRLRPHSDGPSCDASLVTPLDRNSPSVPPGGFLPFCGRVQAIDGPNHMVLVGGRNITLDHLAGYLPDFEDVGRPFADQTGLTGTYDFSLSWLPDRGGSAAQPVDAQGPSFYEALKDQLGLKLIPTHAVVRMLVIDHVEEPTPN
jgi:bla regulator protein blaR1